MNDLKPNLNDSEQITLTKSPTVKIPRRLNEAEEDGIFWGASYVAKRCKNIQVSS